MAFEQIQVFTTTKRLPIVFCLDVSPSMGRKEGNNSSSMELLNVAVTNFVSEIKKDLKANASAEVAFVTFATNIEMDTAFTPVNQLTVPAFKPVEQGKTKMAQAVLRSIEKIEEERNRLENAEIGYFAPFLVLVTDGNPDKNDVPNEYNRALAAVKKHCDSHIGAQEIIVPFIIGVGDYIDAETLNAYAKGFTKGYFQIRGNAARARNFSKVFQLIGNSTKKSIHLNGDASEILSTVQNDMNDLLSDLAGE